MGPPRPTPTPAPVPSVPTRTPTSGRTPTSAPLTGFSKTWAALEYNDFSDATPGSLGGCNARGDGVDAQPTTDSICIVRDKSPCNIAWWDPNEYLEYRFTVPSGGAGNYSIRVRASTARAGKYIGIELSSSSDGAFVASESFLVRADGFQTFNDITWTPKVALRETQYDVRIHSTTGSVNMCSVAITKTNDDPNDGSNNKVLVVPGQYNAMSFTDDFRDQSSSGVGNCPYRKDTSVDAKINQDSICLQAVSEFPQHCNIGWTDPNEYVVYAFTKQASKTSVKVAVRVASVIKRDVQVDLYSTTGGTLVATKQFETPGRGSFDTYDTIVVWNSVNIGNQKLFKMKITFLEGGVNMCSFGIE
jgi:hypothetical protein